jgi:hypothetical protein
MNAGKLVTAGLVAGVAGNVIDYVCFSFIFPGMMKQPFMVTTDPPIAWLVTGDFVAALVAALVYDRVRGSFAAGAAGGATFGLYAGILINIPTWIMMHLLVKDWSYGFAWEWTFYGVVWSVIIGAIIGAVYSRGVSAQPA